MNTKVLAWQLNKYAAWQAWHRPASEKRPFLNKKQDVLRGNTKIPRAKLQIKSNGRVKIPSHVKYFRSRVLSVSNPFDFASWKENLWGAQAHTSTARKHASVAQVFYLHFWIPSLGCFLFCYAFPPCSQSNFSAYMVFFVKVSSRAPGENNCKNQIGNMLCRWHVLSSWKIQHPRQEGDISVHLETPPRQPAMVLVLPIYRTQSPR